MSVLLLALDGSNGHHGVSGKFDTSGDLAGSATKAKNKITTQRALDFDARCKLDSMCL